MLLLVNSVGIFIVLDFCNTSFGNVSMQNASFGSLDIYQVEAQLD